MLFFYYYIERKSNTLRIYFFLGTIAEMGIYLFSFIASIIVASNMIIIYILAKYP